jgi:TonB-dependent receptor
MMTKWLLRSATGVCALAVAGAALAQDAGGAPGRPSGDAPNAVPSDNRLRSQGTPTSGQPGSDEIIVTGIRGSLSAAATIKRNADQVVDSIVAQDIGKFPDPTVAAALQRVPGVQVTIGDNNEVVNPLIRGLGDILTTLNGREVFSGTGRGFSFQDLPAEALAGADVYKSNSANLIEGGVAGLIDLKLHRPFDFNKPTVAVSARNTFSVNTQKSNPTFSGLVSNRFDTGLGEIGVLLSGSYAELDFNRPVAFDDLLRSGNHGPPGAEGAHMPTGTGGLNQFGKQSRAELNGSIQWQASPDFVVYADGLYANYRSKWSTAFIINDAFIGDRITNLVVDQNDCDDYKVNGAGFYDPNGTTERLCNAKSFTALNARGFTSNQAHRGKTDDYIFGGGVSYDHDALHVNLDLNYEHSRFYGRTFIIDIGKRIPQLDVVTNQGGGVDFFAPGNPLSQPEGYTFTNGLYDERIDQVGKLYAAKLDARYDVGGILQNIQFGGRVARRTSQFRQGVVNPAVPDDPNDPDVGPYQTPITGQGLPDDFLMRVPGVPRIYGGTPWLQPSIDALLDADVQDRLRTIFGKPTGDAPYEPARSFYAKEKTYAAYIQGKYEVPISAAIVADGLVGVRWTRTDRDIRGTGVIIVPAPTEIDPNATQAVPTPVARSTSDTDWLPNASIRVRFGGGLQARASYAKVISRPDFGSLNPGLNYARSTNANIQNGGSAGNPDLAPQKADEYDATVEYYFGRSNYITIGVYKKDITGRVVTTPQTEVIDGIPYQISRPRNLAGARLKGIEASAQAFFDFLPGALSGLGAFGNYTLADSKVTASSDALVGETLFGVSKHNFNAGLLYEKYGLSVRTAYTYRSSYDEFDLTPSINIRPVGDRNFLNRVKANGRLDFSVNYDVTQKLTLTVDGTNVTRAKFKSYYGRPSSPHDIRFDDSTYSIGARLRF